MINVLGMLYFSCLLLAIGNHLNNITIPLRMNQSGFDETWIGITMSANALGLIWVPDRQETSGAHRLCQNLCHVLCDFHRGGAFVFLVDEWFFLDGTSNRRGFFTATAYLVVESWINESSSSSNRGRVLGTYLVIHYSGSALGQLMVNLDGPDPSQIFIISAIAIALAAAPVSFSIAPTPESYELESISIPELYRVSPVGLVGVLAAGLAFGG